MIKNHKVQVLGVIMLALTTLLIILSAFSSPILTKQGQSDNILIPVTGNANMLAQYYDSERGLYVAPVQYGLEIYHQSERMQASNWAHSNDPYFKYHQSEWFDS